MQNFKQICKEITTIADQIDKSSIDCFLSYIEEAKHIFLAGAGRSGLIINAFANRLMHLGYSISVVGEISSPHSHPGDLLIINSGSGETLRLIDQVKLAKKNHIKIALITTNNNSSLAKLADCIIVIPADRTTTVQPMGSLFEQSTLILTDSLVLNIMNKTKETNQSMKARHADIE